MFSKYTLDFNQKFIKSKFLIGKKQNNITNITIPLWKTSRLSIITLSNFLEKFFVGINKNKLRIKLKGTAKKNRLVFLIPINENMHVIEHLGHCLPKPKLRFVVSGYVLMFIFHHFRLFIPINKNNIFFVYKFFPLIKRFNFTIDG